MYNIHAFSHLGPQEFNIFPPSQTGTTTEEISLDSHFHKGWRPSDEQDPAGQHVPRVHVFAEDHVPGDAFALNVKRSFCKASEPHPFYPPSVLIACCRTVSSFRGTLCDNRLSTAAAYAASLRRPIKRSVSSPSLNRSTAGIRRIP